MSVMVAILITLAAGLYVGARIHVAREARSTYTAYRARTAKGFTEWIRSTITAAFGVAATIALVLVLLAALRPTG